MTKKKTRIRMRTLEEAKASGLKRATILPGLQWERDTGHYIAEVFIGTDMHGRPKRIHKTFQTQSEAKEWKIKKEAEFKNGGIPENYSTKITIGEILRMYIKSISPRIEKTTLDGYNRILRRIENNSIYGVKLSAFNRYHIDYYLTSNVSAGKLSNKTINKDLELIKSAFNYAVECGFISYNPILKVKKLKEEARELEPYSKNELLKLLECARGDSRIWFRAFILLVSTTGMRRGEVFGLRWEDVDLEKKIISIKNQRIPVDGKIIEKAPKTTKSRRNISIVNECADVLREYRTYQESNGIKDKYVFVNDEGAPFDPKTGDKALKQHIKAHKLRDIRLHDLRHTIATLIQEDGGNLIDVCALLGHSKLSTTANIYSHAREEGAERAAKHTERIIHQSAM